MTRDEAIDLIDKLLDAERDCEMHSHRRSDILARNQAKEQIINALTMKGKCDEC